MNAPRPQISTRAPTVAVLPTDGIRSPVASLVRACAARAIATLDGTPADRVVQRNWSRDGLAAELVLRSAVGPDNMGGSASALMRTVMPSFVATLATNSAAARIFKEGLQLNFDGAGKIAVPTLLADPTYASFVAEGQPISVPQGYVEPLVVLTPYKLGAVMVLTAEMIRSSNVEALIQDALMRSTALALDSTMFDSNPASVQRPQGLRYNLSAKGASSAPDPTEALLEDIQTLHGDVETVTPEHPLYIMSPTRAAFADIRSPHGLDPLTLIGSFALHGTTEVIAVAPHIIVSAFGDTPEIETSHEATLHMDSTPAAIGTPGTPPVVAAPASSMWQADCVAIKIRLPVTWGLRAEIGLAWLQAKNW